MQEKSFNMILSAIGIMAILGFLVSLFYEALKGVVLVLKDFAVMWFFIYLFAVTLGFKGNLGAHKTGPNKSAVEWLTTCMVGLIPVVILLIYT